jgi:hypothetical protein
VLVADSGSISWVGIVIGAAVALLGGVGAQGISIWHEKRTSDEDRRRTEVEKQREAVIALIAAVERGITQIDEGVDPDMTDISNAETLLHVIGDAPVVDQATRLTSSFVNMAHDLRTHDDVNQSGFRVIAAKQALWNLLREVEGKEPL